jgi:hypothetical protein
MQVEQMKRIKRRAKPAAANICPDEAAWLVRMKSGASREGGELE